MLWTGTTTFSEAKVYPQLALDDCNAEARLPKILLAPTQPTEEERELHNLTHLPFRAWCPICTKCKSHGDYHSKQIYDKRPVIQIDYAFLTTTVKRDETTAGTTTPRAVDEKATILTAIDMTTGMTLAAMVTKKG